MPNRKKYEAALRRFNTRYQINVSIDALVEAQTSISSIENLGFQDSVQTSTNIYADILSDVLKIYMDKNIFIIEAGVYGVPDFSLGEFITDFEEVMEEQYRSRLRQRETPNRRPYDGAAFSDMFSFAAGVVSGYGKPIPEVWASGVKKGLMPVDKMREITDGEQDKLMSMDGMLKQKLNGELDAETMNRLTNMVAARDAMEKVRKSRGFFWVLGNLRINRRERKYFNKLKKDCETLKKLGFPVDKVSTQLRGGKFVPDTSYDRMDMEKQTKPWLHGVADYIKKFTKIPGYKQLLDVNLVDRLPQGKRLGLDKFDELIECAHEINGYFDEDIKSGVEPDDAMLSGMKIMFKKAYQLTGSLGYESIKERLVATQILTDFALQELTAAAMKNNPFKEYANGYALGNGEEMITEIETDVASEGLDRDEVINAIDDAAMDWVPSDSRFNMIINELKENVNGDVSPVNQPKESQVPQFRMN